MRHALIALVVLLLGVTLLFAGPPQTKESKQPAEKVENVVKAGGHV